MPVSVWVLCQPLCQDRSPSTPASGGTEGETGRAHCHYWTGVVLQQRYSFKYEIISNHLLNILSFVADPEHGADIFHSLWKCTVLYSRLNRTRLQIKHRAPSCQTTNRFRKAFLSLIHANQTVAGLMPLGSWMYCSKFKLQCDGTRMATESTNLFTYWLGFDYTSKLTSKVRKTAPVCHM